MKQWPNGGPNDQGEVPEAPNVRPGQLPAPQAAGAPSSLTTVIGSEQEPDNRTEHPSDEERQEGCYGPHCLRVVRHGGATVVRQTSVVRPLLASGGVMKS